MYSISCRAVVVLAIGPRTPLQRRDGNVSGFYRPGSGGGKRSQSDGHTAAVVLQRRAASVIREAARANEGLFRRQGPLLWTERGAVRDGRV